MSARMVRRALAAGMVMAVSGIGTALSQPVQAVSTATTYACDTPLGKKDMVSQSDTDFPDVMYVGGPAQSGTYTADVSVPADLMSTAYDLLGARSVEGHSDQTVSVNGVARTFRVTAPRTPIVKGQPLSMKSVGDFGSITPPETPTLLTISVGNSYRSRMVLRKGDGSVASESDSTCTAKGATSGVVDTIRVMARSTTELSLAADTVAEGDQVEVSAAVTVTGGTATGSVAFTAGEVTASAPVSNGQATALLAGLPTGKHDVTAQFIPANAQLYEPSTSQPAPVTVASAADAEPTSMLLDVSHTSAVTGTAVTFTGTVSAESATPTGRVRFQAAGKTFTQPVSAGVAKVTVDNLPAGDHTVTASFSPDRPLEFRTSSASSKALTITPPPPPPGSPTTLSVPELTPAVHGRLVAVTAYVSAENGASPTGTVRFEVAGHVRDVPVSEGRATASLPKLAVGTHQVRTQFIPEDESFRPSTGTIRMLTVVPSTTPVTPETSAPTQVILSPQARSPQFMTAVPLRATVTNPAAQGSVRFTIGSVSRSATVRGGVATVSFPGLKVGRHQLLASFTPTDPAAFRASTTSRPMTVVKATTSTTVTLRRVSDRRLVAGVLVKTKARGNRCHTKATVVLVRSGKPILTRTAKVGCKGSVTVPLTSARVRTRGSYQVTVKYAGSAGLEKSAKTLHKRL